MENVKEEIIKKVNNLPEDITWEDALYTLYLYSKIQKSEEDLRNGRYCTLEEFDNYIREMEEEYESGNIR